MQRYRTKTQTGLINTHDRIRVQTNVHVQGLRKNTRAHTHTHTLCSVLAIRSSISRGRAEICRAEEAGGGGDGREGGGAEKKGFGRNTDIIKMAERDPELPQASTASPSPPPPLLPPSGRLHDARWLLQS